MDKISAGPGVLPKGAGKAVGESGSPGTGGNAPGKHLALGARTLQALSEPLTFTLSLKVKVKLELFPKDRGALRTAI